MKRKTNTIFNEAKGGFLFKELMEDEEVRNAFLAAVLGINVEDVVEQDFAISSASEG